MTKRDAKDSLVRRRAEFVYGAMILIAKQIGVVDLPKPYRLRSETFRLLLESTVEFACDKKRNKSLKHLHEFIVKSYTALEWKYGKEFNLQLKISPVMTEYKNLNKRQMADLQLLDSLCRIAGQWIY